MVNQANTNQGTSIEHLFANSITYHPKCFDLIKKACGIPKKAELIKDMEVIGATKRKTDVEGDFGNSHPLLRVSIKSFTSAGYNHLERRGLRRFCAASQIKKADCVFLEKIIIRKALKGGDLVYQNERNKVRKIFSRLEVGASAIKGNDHPQILALFSVNTNRWHCYDIDRQIIPAIRQTNIGFTPRSGNIELCEYIVLQRNGSQQGEKGIDLSSIEHRANDVQLKIRVKKLFNEIEPMAWYQL